MATGGSDSGRTGRTIVARTSSLRSQLYRVARDLGNVQAAEKGPSSYAKRVARRKIYAKSSGLDRRLIRSLGL